jgi:hypothetical protein
MTASKILALRPCSEASWLRSMGVTLLDLDPNCRGVSGHRSSGPVLQERHEACDGAVIMSRGQGKHSVPQPQSLRPQPSPGHPQLQVVKGISLKGGANGHRSRLTVFQRAGSAAKKRNH